MNHRPCRLRLRRPIARLGLACVLLLTSLVTAPLALSQTDSAAPAPAPVEVEIVEEDGGLFDGVTDFLMDFQRRANAEVAFHMNAIERGDNLGALILALAVAFAYGAIHAFGPGHGKFVVVSYFLGREARVMRGVVMAVQIAIVHVIAAIVIVWLADLVLRGGFGLALSDVPGVRAASFLIIVGIGLYMLYQAVRASLRARSGGASDHGHSHDHSPPHRHDHTHPHHHGHHHHHGHSHGGKAEGGILALAAGMVPCPGAVLIMLYAVANDMIVPGSLLVAAMSLGIGSSICVLGVGAILARQAAMRMMERSGGGGANALRHGMNYAGAALVTLVGLVSFIAFLNTPLG